jgi:NADPH:quinone reductase-like Zn-dependent oxidoreductase
MAFRGRRAEAMQATGVRAVVSTAAPDWRAEVERVTQGARLVHGIDSLGGEAANTLLSLLCEGGTLVSFGSAVSLTLPLHVEHLLYKQATVRGFWAARRAATLDAAERRRLIGQVIDLVASGEIALTLDAAMTLADIAVAAEHATRPNRSGKVALHPGPEQFVNRPGPAAGRA